MKSCLTSNSNEDVKSFRKHFSLKLLSTVELMHRFAFAIPITTQPSFNVSIRRTVSIICSPRSGDPNRRQLAIQLAVKWSRENPGHHSPCGRAY